MVQCNGMADDVSALYLRPVYLGAVSHRAPTACLLRLLFKRIVVEQIEGSSACNWKYSAYPATVP